MGLVVVGHHAVTLYITCVHVHMYARTLRTQPCASGLHAITVFPKVPRVATLRVQPPLVLVAWAAKLVNMDATRMPRSIMSSHAAGQGQETTRQAFHVLVGHFEADPAWLLQI